MGSRADSSQRDRPSSFQAPLVLCSRLGRLRVCTGYNPPCSDRRKLPAPMTATVLRNPRQLLVVDNFSRLHQRPLVHSFRLRERTGAQVHPKNDLSKVTPDRVFSKLSHFSPSALTKCRTGIQLSKVLSCFRLRQRFPRQRIGHEH